MQEIKHLMLRLGTVANMDEYVFDGPMADAHVQGYLNQGWTVHTVHPGAIDQGTSSISILYVLVRDDERKRGTFAERAGSVEAETPPSEGEGLPTDPKKININKWQTSEDPALASS